jgi:hypothetical protein
MFDYQRTTRRYILEDRTLLANPFSLTNMKQHNRTWINTKMGKFMQKRECTGGIEEWDNQAKDAFTDADASEFI